ncbi:MAG: hypothetical protein LPK00_05910 [Bacillaceae bacterium]|nr:hypothetical protein [Bacillaceae bacterium]
MAYFVHDKRLGIQLPKLELEWSQYSKEQQQQILVKWELIRGSIPDRIKDLEHSINTKQEQLNNEADFEKSCKLNSDIAELASIINDLWLWYRLNQEVSSKIHS